MTSSKFGWMTNLVNWEGVSKKLIQDDFIVKPKELKKYHPIPADKYQVQITDVNLVKVMSQFSGKEEDRLNFEFTVLDNKNWDFVDEEGEKQIESTRGRRLWKRVSPSISPSGKRSKASWLYKLLCAVEKKELKDEEISELNPNSLVGSQLQVMVEVAGEYNNILAFSAVEKELEPVPNADERVQEGQEVVTEEEAEVIFAEDPKEKKGKDDLPF